MWEMTIGVIIGAVAGAFLMAFGMSMSEESREKRQRRAMLKSVRTALRVGYTMPEIVRWAYAQVYGVKPSGRWADSREERLKGIEKALRGISFEPLLVGRDIAAEMPDLPRALKDEDV